MTGDARDSEAAWRDLVAHYAAPGTDDVPGPWPDREDLPRPEGDGTPPASQPGGAGPVPGVIPGPPQFRIIRPASQVPPSGAEEPPPDGDDEHFIPPAPPPLPRLDAVSKAAWLAIFGGPAYLLVAVMAGLQIPGWAAFCAVAAFVGGFATLVARMPDRPPTDSGPDDGAVV